MTDTNLTAKVEVKLDDRGVANGARRVNSTMTGIARNATRSTTQLGRVFNATTAKMQGMARKFNGTLATLGLGMGAGIAVKKMVDWGDALRDIRRDLEATEKQMESMDQAIFNSANKYGVSAKTIADYVALVAKSTKDYDKTIASLNNGGAIAVGAFGLNAEEMQGREHLKEKFNIKDERGMNDSLASIANADGGRFDGKEILAAATALMNDYQGEKSDAGLKDLFAYIQGQGATAQTLDEVVSNLKSFIADVGTEKNRKFLVDRGGKSADPYTRVGNENIMKPLDDIAKIIADDTKTGRNKDKLWYSQSQSIANEKFNKESARAMAGLLKNPFKQQSTESGAAEELALDKSKNFSAALDRLTNAMMRFAEINLTKPIENFAEFLASVDPTALEEFLQTASNIAKALGITYGLVKVGGLAKSGYDLITSSKSVVDSVSDMVGVQKVWVMNPEFGGGGLPDGGKNGGGKGGGIIAPLLLKGLTVLGLALSVKSSSRNLTPEEQAERNSARADHRENLSPLVDKYGEEWINKALESRIGGSPSLETTPQNMIEEAIKKQLMIDAVGEDYAKAAFKKYADFFTGLKGFKGQSADQLAEYLTKANGEVISERTPMGKGRFNTEVFTPEGNADVVANLIKEITNQQTAIKTLQDTPPPEGTINVVINTITGKVTTAIESAGVKINAKVGSMRTEMAP